MREARSDEKNKGKKLQAEFFQYENGSRPVHDWLMCLSREDRKIIGGAIGAVEFEWPVGAPRVKKIGKVWEIRAIVASGWARIYFVIDDGTMYLLHGAVKKSKKVSRDDTDVTMKRLGMLLKLKKEEKNASQ